MLFPKLLRIVLNKGPGILNIQWWWYASGEIDANACMKSVSKHYVTANTYKRFSNTIKPVKGYTIQLFKGKNMESMAA